MEIPDLLPRPETPDQGESIASKHKTRQDLAKIKQNKPSDSDCDGRTTQSVRSRKIQLSSDWLALLDDWFEQPQMQKLSEFLLREKRQGKQIFPPGEQIFAAFNYCSPQQCKVVILGQDPYHGPGQACGLSFAVPSGVALPPSLQNIYKELQDDLPQSSTAKKLAQKSTQSQIDGQLIGWAQQGVLLLNSVLSVEVHKPASHAGKGWEAFTDQVILRLSEQKKHLVFLLWGSYAQKKAACIDDTRHCLLRSPHPSPLSAHRGFFGSRPFSRCNAYLEKHGYAPIDW